MYAIGTLLGVRGFPITHVGVYLGNGMVFHNHWRNNAEIISLHKFSNGRNIFVLENGTVDVGSFLVRLQQVILQSRSYNALTNNCEHAASYVRVGEAHSAQLASFVVVAFIGISIWALSVRK